MTKKSIAKLILVLFSCVLLASCSNFMKNHAPGAGSEATPTTEVQAPVADDSAQTQGIADEADYNVQNVAGESTKLQAPCNQVYHFDFDQNAVHQNDIASINAQANYLVTHQNARIRLEGNTDARGSREYNVALGWRRAQAVAELLKQQGVPERQLVLISYGKEKPLAMGHDESSYAQNRRVNLVYEVK